MRPEVLSDDGAGTPSIDGVVAGGIKPSGGEHHFVGGKNGFHPKILILGTDIPNNGPP